MESSPASRDKHLDPYLRWGVVPGPWLAPIHLRILFVLDGRISTVDGPECFGLGPVLNTLADSSFSWSVRFDVDVVRRDDGHRMNCVDLSIFDLFSRKLNSRFNQSHFDYYDQICL